MTDFIFCFVLEVAGEILNVWFGAISVNFCLVCCLEDAKKIEGVWGALEAFFKEVVDDLNLKLA